MPSLEGPRTAFMPREFRLAAPRLIVLTGDRKGEELEIGLLGDTLTVGSDSACGLVFERLDPVHAELGVERDAVRVRDRSGGRTRLNGIPIDDALLEIGGTLEVGGIELRLAEARDPRTILPSARESFGGAIGRSLAMREVFGILEGVAPTRATILLLGETGSGKEVLAHAIHDASPRMDRAMVTVDCGAIAPTLIESELFGHERGAFTGAEEEHRGAFERAGGSTLFLDEIGELPIDVQSKLLRAIDEREIQRVGSGRPIRIDVRIVSATKRDLEREVRAGRFREDLFFRLAVVPIVLPPLRARRDDIPLLVEHFCRAFTKRTGHPAKVNPEEVPNLVAHDWPGNVRELRNTVERALWFAQTGDGIARFVLPTPESLLCGSIERAEGTASPHFDPTATFSESKAQWEREFEREYLPWLLARAAGSLSKASRLAQMDRKHLRALLRKHDLIAAGAASSDEPE